jgi:glycosyltransferase involved in cell wall biosynthesis
MRGAERTFESIAGCWSDAPIFTLVYDREGTLGRFTGRTITASYLQHLRLRQHNFRRALPLFPHAAESLRIREHDVVISSSSAFAHGASIPEEAVHICYCHSPFRYAWHERDRACSEVPRRLRPLLGRVLDRMRDWDLRAAGRVTHYIANSETTRRRIQEFYARDAAVIHPPVDVARLQPGQGGDYALIVSEITAHKRIELALEAARAVGQPVKVVGTGPDLPRLRCRFGDSAEFLGRVADGELISLYAGARMFLMANVEEFGIAAVEAQAAGRPVIAAAAGGALETVISGETGVLVPQDDVNALAEAIRYTDFDRFSPAAARSNAERFSVNRFRAQLHAEVASLSGEQPAVTGPLAQASERFAAAG